MKQIQPSHDAQRFAIIDSASHHQLGRGVLRFHFTILDCSSPFKIPNHNLLCFAIIDSASHHQLGRGVLRFHFSILDCSSPFKIPNHNLLLLFLSEPASFIAVTGSLGWSCLYLYLRVFLPVRP
jgi:hypothetical protein